MDSYSDSTLIREVLHGQKELYSVLVDRYSPALAAVAKNYLHDTQEVEKLISEVFVEAYRELRRMSDHELFFTLLLNQTRSKLKARAVLTDAPLDTSANPKFEWDVPQDVQLMRLKYFDGKSYEEVGQSLQLPPESIEQKIRQSRSWDHFARAGAEIS